MTNVAPVPDQLPSDRPPSPVEVIRAIRGHLPQVRDALSAVSAALNRTGTLSPRLVELVRLRIAFHNQCRTCMAVRHAPEDLDEGLVCSLERPAEAADLTDAERAALHYADLFTNDHLAIDAAVYDGLRAHFDEAQIVELGIRCAQFLGQGRLAATWNVLDELPESFQTVGDAPITPWGHERVLTIH
jgi:alkylhydroperoxidase family enzyme